MVQVPDLKGKIEEEAQSMANDIHIGLKFMGEEVSTQEKGRISSQDIEPGTMVQEYTTVKYYISKGAPEVTVPEVDGRTGIDAQQMLEDMGFTVNVQKEYSELDYDGNSLVEPGMAYYTMPEAGTTVKSSDTITLVISRGVDYGDYYETPGVVGLQKDEAITTLGKFLEVRVEEQMNSEVPAGEVIAQNPEPYEYVDPDEGITITVSTGSVDPSAQVPQTDAEVTDTQQPDASQQAAADGEIWKCTQSLNTPTGYNGGLVRLELLQEVNGIPTAKVITEGQPLQFPYDLDITGAPGVADGTLYLSEEVNGDYIELGHYPIKFEKAE